MKKIIKILLIIGIVIGVLISIYSAFMFIGSSYYPAPSVMIWGGSPLEIVEKYIPTKYQNEISIRKAGFLSNIYTSVKDIDVEINNTKQYRPLSYEIIYKSSDNKDVVYQKIELFPTIKTLLRSQTYADVQDNLISEIKSMPGKNKDIIDEKVLSYKYENIDYNVAFVKKNQFASRGVDKIVAQAYVYFPKDEIFVQVVFYKQIAATFEELEKDVSEIIHELIDKAKNNNINKGGG